MKKEGIKLFREASQVKSEELIYQIRGLIFNNCDENIVKNYTETA